MVGPNEISGGAPARPSSSWNARNCSGCQPSPPCSFGHFPVNQPREPRRFSQESYSCRSKCWPRACLRRTSAGISLLQNSRTSERKASSSALCWTARMNIALSLVDRGFLQQDPAVAVLPTIIDKYLPLSIADIGHTLPVPHRASAALYPDWRV